MLIYRNAEGVHGQRKFDNACPKPKSCPVAAGIFRGLSPPNKAPSPLNWNMKHYKSLEFLLILECQATPPHKRKDPEPIYWKLSGDGSAWTSTTATD